MNIGNKMDSKPLEERVSFLEGKIEGSLEQMNKRLESLERSIESLRSNEIKNLSDRIDKMSEKVDKINDRLWQVMILLIASIIAPVLLKIIFH
ncbi:MAG: hypothetical protein ACP5M7_09590 [Thermoproteota archaeon]